MSSYFAFDKCWTNRHDLPWDPKQWTKSMQIKLHPEMDTQKEKQNRK